MTVHSSSLPMLALLWFSPLLIVLLVNPCWLVLLCVILLFVYGLLLFRAGEKLSASYRPSRFFPWLVWVLALFGLTGFQSVPVPVFPVSRPVKDLYSIPVSVNGVRHGLSSEEVRALHGQPGERQIQHTILPIRIYDGEIQIFMAEVMRLQFKFADSIRFPNREQLDFLLSKQIGTRTRAQIESPRPNGFKGVEVAVDQVQENLESGFPLQVFATEEELTNEKIENLINGQGEVGVSNRAYLFVNKDEAVYTMDFAKEAWIYPDRGLEVVFGKDDEVVSVRGSELWLGNRLWARTGDPIEKIRRPGEPPLNEDQELQAILSNRLPEFAKKWGSRTIGIRVSKGLMTSFEL